MLLSSAFFVTVRAGTAYRKIWRLVKNFFCSHNKVHCSEIPIVLSNLLYHYFFHWIMAHFNFMISQNAKWGMPVFTLIATGWGTEKYSFTKKALLLRHRAKPHTAFQTIKLARDHISAFVLSFPIAALSWKIQLGSTNKMQCYHNDMVKHSNTLSFAETSLKL